MLASGNGNGAGKDEIGRSGQRYGARMSVFQMESNLKAVPAPNLDRDGRGGLGQVVMDQGGGDDSGAAGKCLLLDAAFIGSDPEGSWREDLDEIRVRSGGGEALVIPERSSEFNHRGFPKILDEVYGMGHAGVEGVDLQIPFTDPQGMGQLEAVRLAHP